MSYKVILEKPEDLEAAINKAVEEDFAIAGNLMSYNNNLGRVMLGQVMRHEPLFCVKPGALEPATSIQATALDEMLSAETRRALSVNRPGRGHDPAAAKTSEFLENGGDISIDPAQDQQKSVLQRFGKDNVTEDEDDV